VARAEAALALVQDRVRYVALAMGAGGYVPADAAETWSRRYGDCKGKTALLLVVTA
jgi:transglutaminase-like putative cysteine protease